MGVMTYVEHKDDEDWSRGESTLRGVQRQAGGLFHLLFIKYLVCALAVESWYVKLHTHTLCTGSKKCLGVKNNSLIKYLYPNNLVAIQI